MHFSENVLLSKHSIGDNLIVDLSTRKLSVTNGHDVLLTADIGLKLPTPFNYQIVLCKNDELEVNWGSANLVISRNVTLSDSKVVVNDISWTTDTLDEMSDAFEMLPYHWYGGSELFNQKWPIEKTVHPMWSYTTSDIYKPGYGNVMERYWLVSSHVAITVDDDVPLLVSLNDADDNRLRFLSRYKSTLYSNFVDDKSRPFLKYKLWMNVDQSRTTLKDLHLNVMNKYFTLVEHLPDRKMFESPIWTTWAKYKHDINQEKVLKFAEEIVENNFCRCQLEIDDKWEYSYGDLKFDSTKFPDPRRMIESLHELGFRVTLWVHPFANFDSETAQNQSYANFWVQTVDGTPARVSWWNGEGYMLDTTNDDALQWFVDRLNEFKTNFNIDSFKFDAGETNWLPDNFKLKNANQPNQYSTNYVCMASQFGPLIETRVNSRNQKAPNFLRIMDKDSSWTDQNGLKTLIPVSLLFAMLNRPFILPDIVGGNAYRDEKPDRELFIRWTAVNVFLPSIQFSIAPWDYDDECVEIVRNYVELHKKYSKEIFRLATQSTIDASPIVRPLWWTGDECEPSLVCDDQFMLGDDLMVAPVLDRGAIVRSVYLPRGCKWRSILDGKLYEGGEKIIQNATVNQLPYYIKE